MGPMFDRSVVVGLGVVVALLVVNAGVSYRNTRQLHEDAGWVAHTQEVLDLSADVLLTLVDAETGQRGFLIAGEDEFLRPFDDALARLNERLGRLKEKTRDNRRQQVRIAELERMTAELLARLKAGIDRRRRKADAAQAVAAIRAGKEQMDAIRGMVGDLEREEHALLADRERRSERAYGVAVATGLLTAALGLVMVVAFAGLLRRSLKARQRPAAGRPDP